MGKISESKHEEELETGQQVALRGHTESRGGRSWSLISAAASGLPLLRVHLFAAKSGCE